MTLQEKNSYLDYIRRKIDDYGEVSTTEAHNDQSIAGDDFLRLFALIEPEGYLKEKRDGLYYIRRDPNHELAESVKKTNAAVQANIGFQSTQFKITTVLSGISIFFIIVTAYNQCQDKSESELRGIKSELQSIQKAMKKLELEKR